MAINTRSKCRLPAGAAALQGTVGRHAAGGRCVLRDFSLGDGHCREARRHGLADLTPQDPAGMKNEENPGSEKN